MAGNVLSGRVQSQWGNRYSVRDECLGWDGEAAACGAAAIDPLPPNRRTRKQEAETRGVASGHRTSARF